jgi:uncharacterized protein YbaR (Trm112 family)
VYIELIDLLRCPRDHEETWLVAAFTKVRDRFVEEARLGCPVCSAAYVIRHGTAEFAGEFRQSTATVETTADTDAAIRLAAFLNLTRPGSTAILQGSHAALARTVSEITQSRTIALDPVLKIDDTELTATIRSDQRIPLASSSVDAVTLSDSRYVNDVSRVLRQGGRLLTPVDVPLPAGVTELARDDRVVVGEAHGPVIPIRRTSHR